VRGADARSAQIRSPDGVARSFQVSVYKVKPGKGKRARNLLSKDDWRAALADEAEELGPQVALVVESFAGTCDAESLAWAAARPRASAVSPSGPAQGKRPDANAGEEVALREGSDVVRLNIDN
jgi:hypothetical protein